LSEGQTAAMDELRTVLESQAEPPRIIAVGETVSLPNGRRIICCIEVWSWRVVVRFTDVAWTPMSRDERLRQREDVAAQRAALERRLHAGETWRLADDLGTSYQRTSEGHGGDGVWVDGHVRFDPAPPQGALELVLTSPEGHETRIGLSE
jgi:hypothetical protein